MKVKQFLSSLRANRYTYKNISIDDVERFQKLYNYLKKHKNKELYKNVFFHNDALKNQIYFWLNNKNEADMLKGVFDFVRKYKAMELISQNIKV